MTAANHAHSVCSSLVQFTISSATIPQLSPSCLSLINGTVPQVTATCHQMVHITDVVTDRASRRIGMTSQVATPHSSSSLLPCQMSCSDVTPSNTCTACAINSTVFCLVSSSDIIHLTANCTMDHPWTTSANNHHHHHIRFWYLRCCGCPGLRGMQHLATPHTRSP